MSVLFRSKPVEQRSVRLPAWVQQGVNSPFAANAGIYVDDDTALRHDAYWACVNRISQDVGMMPVDVVRYERGRRIPVDVLPEIIATPSLWVESLDWRTQVVAAWLSDGGNAWGLITKVSPTGLPLRIELQPSTNVLPVANGSEIKFYVGGVEESLYPVGRLWHVPGYTRPGQFLGMSVVQYHAATVGRGLAAGKFGGDFFTDGGHPTAILSPETDPGEQGAKDLKAAFLRAMRGNREPLVLPRSITYTPIQVNPDDSQFIETMQYSVEQICRIFGEDPADYGSSGGGSSLTYANRSDADVARLKRRQFWTTKLQTALTALLPPGQVARLNTSAALMMTTAERHELHALRLKAKTTTVNEVRVIEDEEPFKGPEFDEPGIPGGFTTEPTQGGAK